MKTITKITTGVFALLFMFGVTQTTHAQNVVETAQGVDDLSTLVSLVGQAGLADTLAEAEDITVFAPTNVAFQKVPSVLMRAINNDPDILVDILTYHVSPDRLSSGDVVGMDDIPTLQGSDIDVRVAGKNVFLDGSSKIIAVDIDGGNATVHLINRVLIPWDMILPDVIRALSHR